MRRKSIITAAILLALVIAALSAMLICPACDKKEKTSWTVSAEGGCRIARYALRYFFC